VTEGCRPSLISYSGERFQLKAAFEEPGGSKQKKASKHPPTKRGIMAKFLNVISWLGIPASKLHFIRH
jgi:hypothetical protein